MHRTLRENRLAGERRNQAKHPARTRPDYDLYVVLDIFSRFVVAWTIAACEDSEIAKALLEEAMGTYGIPDAIHADRGTSMTSKPVAQLMVDLGVARSHLRPHVSNDNPYSEAAFKTLKYAPTFPESFGSLADARAFGERFFGYYNHEHRRQRGLGKLTPVKFEMIYAAADAA